MDTYAKRQLEMLIIQQNRELVQDLLKDSEDLGPLLGSFINSALLSAKAEVYSRLLASCSDFNATPIELKEWLDGLFSEELKKYMQL